MKRIPMLVLPQEVAPVLGKGIRLAGAAGRT